MAFDWKKVLSTTAPVLATALGTPLAGQAVSVILGALGLDPATSNEADIANALEKGKLTGEQMVALREADNTFKLEMARLNVDVQRLADDMQRAYIADTADARRTFGANENVFVLGVCILVGFVVLMVFTLVGCFLLLTGYFKFDPNIATFCSGLIGTVVGYVAANAQQVVSYFFGSSKGSKDSGDAIGQALTQTLQSQNRVVETASATAATAALDAATK